MSDENRRNEDQILMDTICLHVEDLNPPSRKTSYCLMSTL